MLKTSLVPRPPYVFSRGFGRKAWGGLGTRLAQNYKNRLGIPRVIKFNSLNYLPIVQFELL